MDYEINPTSSEAMMAKRLSHEPSVPELAQEEYYQLYRLYCGELFYRDLAEKALRRLRCEPVGVWPLC